MDPLLFYSASDSSQWREIALIQTEFKAYPLERQVQEVGEYPHPWKTDYTANTLWDEKLLGESWAALATEPMIHPLVMPKISQLLNLLEDDLWALAWWKVSKRKKKLVHRDPLDKEPSGIHVIQKLLAKATADGELIQAGLTPLDLVTNAIPIPPLKLRLKENLASGVTIQPGMFQYLHLMVQKLTLFRDYRKEQAGKKNVWDKREEEAHLCRQQEWFEKILLLNEVGSTLTSRWNIEEEWEIASAGGSVSSGFDPQQPEAPDLITPDMVVDDWEIDSPELYAKQSRVPLALSVLDEGRLWMQFQDKGRVMDLKTGKMSNEFSTKGELIGWAGKTDWLGYKYVEHICLLDLGAEKWKDAYKGLRFAFVEELGNERPYLVDISRQQAIQLEEILDYPMPPLRSGDGKFVWAEDKEAHGGIYDTETGWLIFSPGYFDSDLTPRLLTKAGELQALSDAAWDIVEETLEEAADKYRNLEIPLEYQQNSFGRREGSWWFFFMNTLWINDQPIWRTDQPITAAAFGKDCKCLYLANSQELTLLDLDEQGVMTEINSISLQPI